MPCFQRAVESCVTDVVGCVVEAMHMLGTRSRTVRHTEEERTQWTPVHSAKARANKAKASTARSKKKKATDAHNLDSTKPANTQPDVEIGGLRMSYYNLDASSARVCMDQDWS